MRGGSHFILNMNIQSCQSHLLKRLCFTPLTYLSSAVENQLTVYMKDLILDYPLYSTDLYICLALCPVHQTYLIVIVLFIFWSMKVWVLHLLSTFSKGCFCYAGSLDCPYNFRISVSNSAKLTGIWRVLCLVKDKLGVLLP